MDATWAVQAYQHWVKRLQLGLNGLGQDVNSLVTQGKNVVFNAAGLAIKAGGTSPDFLTANTIYYVIGNAVYSKAAVADTAPTAAAVQAISTVSIHLVVIDAAGTISTVAGTPAASAPVIPACPSTKAPIGFLRVTTDGTHTFTAGTTNLDAAGITTVYVDFVGSALMLTPPTAYPHAPTRADAGGVDIATLSPEGQDTLPLNLG